MTLRARRVTLCCVRYASPQASLGAEVKPGRNVLMVKQEDMETEYALCSLTEGKLECTPLDLYFRDETVTFAVSGQCEIHLSGHVIDDAADDSDEDDESGSESESKEGATANGAMPAAQCVAGRTGEVSDEREFRAAGATFAPKPDEEDDEDDSDDDDDEGAQAAVVLRRWCLRCRCTCPESIFLSFLN